MNRAAAGGLTRHGGRRPARRMIRADANFGIRGLALMTAFVAALAFVDYDTSAKIHRQIIDALPLCIRRNTGGILDFRQKAILVNRGPVDVTSSVLVVKADAIDMDHDITEPINCTEVGRYVVQMTKSHQLRFRW